MMLDVEVVARTRDMLMNSLTMTKTTMMVAVKDCLLSIN